MKKTLVWLGALLAGTLLGMMNMGQLNAAADAIAAVYIRLFQLLAVPTIVLAVTTTMATMGASRDTGRIFRRTLTYTLLTTVCAAATGALLYVVVSPQAESLQSQLPSLPSGADGGYFGHLISVVPDNIVRPFLEGNVLSLLLVAFAAGIGLSRLPETEEKAAVVKLLTGLQELVFLLIGWLVRTLPVGIIAFAAQLSAQLSAGVMAESLGKYILVVLGSNIVQSFIILPLFLTVRGLNPLRVLRCMSPAVLTALFTKSSAATLPVTMEAAERRLGVRREVARFVLPICTTINMNGCAAFILVTSLFVMQGGGTPVTFGTILVWLLVSVVSAVGNAGVPMGCYFLTFSLMSGIGAPVAVLGLILPVYAVIDMVETAENVWSDSCVCAMTDYDLKGETL